MTRAFTIRGTCLRVLLSFWAGAHALVTPLSSPFFAWVADDLTVFPCHIEPHFGLFYVAGFPRVPPCPLSVFVCHVVLSFASSVFFLFCFFGFLWVGVAPVFGVFVARWGAFTNHYSP